jgi:hypothetical protein
MTSSNTVSDLAERCEAATGPDRELSWDIWEAIGEPVIDDYSLNGSAPAYTASLDAAMTLVPEGYYWTLSLGCKAGRDSEFGPYWAELYSMADYRSHIDVEEIPGTTPALALCAAALKARTALKQARNP